MMKNFKKLIACLLSMIIMFSFLPIVQAQGTNVDRANIDILLEQQSYYTDSANIIKELGEDVHNRMLNQAEALEAYNYLLNTKLRDSSGNINYPDDYAGEYIEDGKLILLTNDSQKNKQYEEYLSDYNVVRIKNVAHSYKELNEYAESFIRENNYYGMSYQVSPRDNTIVFIVDGNNLSEVKKSYNEKLSDSKLGLEAIYKDVELLFEETQEAETAAVNLYGVMGISNGIQAYTLGFCGTYNGSAAIITAGHKQSSTGYILYGSSIIGSIAKVQFASGQKGDYSVATITNSGYTTTNQVASEVTTYSITGSMEAPVGTLLYRYGASSGGLEALEVYEKNVSVTLKEKPTDTSGTTVTGMVRCTYISGVQTVGGDSGGPIYTTNSSGKWVAVGTTVAVIGNINQPGYRVYYNPMANATGFTVKSN